MLKIVKSRVYNYDTSKPVPVGEPEPKPVEPVEEEQEEEQISPEELARIAELERQKKLEEDAKRFNEAVIKRSEEIIGAKKAQMEAEYKRLVNSGYNNAERLISDAKAKTKAVLDAAEEESVRIKQKAEISGFEAGFEAGKNEAMKTCEKYLEAAAKLLAEINAKKEAYYISNEYEMCETVMDMVKKITMEEVKTDPSVIDRICKNAAKNFRNSDYLKITLAKGEASKALVTDKEFLKSLIPYIPEIEIEELDIEDAPPGTVVLDNGSEIIDASIPTQLDFLREIMRSSHSESE